jgi:hypothetical protein
MTVQAWWVLAAETGLFVLILAFVRWSKWTIPPRLERLLDGPALPLLAAATSAALVSFVWGSLDQPAVVHDERAYVLQARIFASGRWTADPPPAPEFFEQMHVFVEPRVAPKYPPGHALLLAPGVAVGLPGLVPVVASAVTAALIVVLTRRFHGGVVALVVWSLWATSTASLIWLASYLSETSTGALWLLSWWIFLAWRGEYRTRFAVLLGVVAGWMYITRPLTAVGLGAVLGVAVLVEVARTRRRWSLLAMMAGAVPVLALSLVWQHQVAGDWWTSPYAEYSRQYFPFDKPGFGFDGSLPLRTVPEELASVGRDFQQIHRHYVPSAVPRALFVRIVSVLGALFTGWRVPLLLLAGIGALMTRGVGGYALASVGTLFIAYLAFAHPPQWTLYYLEIYPVLWLVAVVELQRLLVGAVGFTTRQATAALVLLLMAASPAMASDVIRAKSRSDEAAAFHRSAGRALAGIHDKSVVFVHYERDHNAHLLLTSNSADPPEARLWIVTDRGARNERLLTLTDRPAYRLFTEDWRLERIR